MKLRPFELGLVIIFLVLAMGALFLLATFSGGTSEDDLRAARIGSVTIWGTLPADQVDGVLRQLRDQDEAYRNVEYRYYPSDQFDSALTNALADGRGPDLTLVEHEKLVDMRRRIQPIPYDTFPIRDVRSRYIDGAEIYALADGVYGLPIAVDPLMLYWNRDILSTAGFLEPPRTWETLINMMFPELIQRDFGRTISQSVVAMGEYRNVRNGFGILSMILLQNGSQMVLEREANEYSIQLNTATGGSGDPLRVAATFYTGFVQPSSALYSWNRSLQEDRQEFTAEDLVFYFGYASEGPVIERINPNLNFDIAEVPQGANASVRRTYGTFYALSLLRASDNVNGAYEVMQTLGAPAQAEAIAVAVDMVPVYRSSVAAGSNDKYGRISYQSAAVTRGWLNPAVREVDAIFTTMTSDINENRTSVSGAVSDVSNRLRDAY